MTNIVGIYDNDFNQVFLDTRFIKASVIDISELFTQPLEDGTQIIDHKIDKPIEIDLQIILSGADYKNTYNAIKKLKTDGEQLTIQTKTDVYPNMVIGTLPYEEDAEVYDGIKLNVTLIQAEFQTPTETVVPRFQKDANSQRNGNVQGQEVTEEKRTSVLASIL